MKKSRREIKARILRLKSKRVIDRSVSMTEITRSLFSATWKNYIDDVKTVARLNKQNLIKITQKGKKLGPRKLKSSVNLSLKSDR